MSAEEQAGEVIGEIFKHKWAGKYAEHCGSFRELTRQMIIWRDPVSDALDQFLFDKCEGSGTSTMRSKMEGWGAGSLMTSMFGEAAPVVTPWSQIFITRELDDRVNTEVKSLPEKPTYGEVPWDPPSDFEGTWGTLHIEGLHLTVPYESKSVSDVAWCCHTGASPKTWEGYMDIFAWENSGQAWVGSPTGDYEIYKQVWLKKFPAMSEYANKILNLKDMVHTPEPAGDGKTVNMKFVIPWDAKKVNENYAQLGAIMGLADPLVLRFKHSETGVVFSTMTIKDLTITCEHQYVDGKPSYAAAEGTGIAFDSEGNFLADLEVEGVLKPLGDLAPIALPKMGFRITMTATGGMKVKCTEAGESAYEKVASLAFDYTLFRKLLVESFAVEMTLVKVAKGYAVRNFFRCMFPSQSATQLIKDWWRTGFVREQVKNADLLKAVTDMLTAIKSDIETNLGGGGYAKTS